MRRCPRPARGTWDCAETDIVEREIVPGRVRVQVDEDHVRALAGTRVPCELVIRHWPPLSGGNSGNVLLPITAPLIFSSK